MKKVILSAFAVLALLFANNSVAQISHGGEPMFNKSMAKAAVPELSMPTLDNELYLNEDINAAKGAGPMRVGITQETRLSVTDEAKTVSLDLSFIPKKARKNMFLFADSGDADSPWSIKRPNKLPTAVTFQPRGGILLVARP